ncbi:MAG: CRISPR-associated endonuclease Cas1 [Chloroherpetonaceae bacterium]|nr:CRISPR-associated endonuclease Cas1 [Chthonomonadaceae bacterium]MDW8209287.1 CRISPR-associated endonuclease Cas1 [Chloroherpetonaceae bacterium]
MGVLYVQEQGAYLRKRDERIVVELDREVVRDIPLIQLEQIVCLGNVQVSSQTLALLLEQGVDLCFLTQHGRFRGRVVGEFSRNARIRQAQWEVAQDPERELGLAARFVVGKLRNQRAVLQRHLRQYGSEDHPGLAAAVDLLADGIRAVPGARTLDALRGIEGEAASVYFGVFGSLIRQPGFAFTQRLKHPPRDAVNALLSFTYTLLMNEVLAAIHVVGLDPYVGFLHAERHGKASLAFDLMEEFRPCFADTLVLSLINNRVVSPEDFEQTLDACLLREGARRRFFEQYERKKNDEVRHPVFKYRASYRRCFELQVRLLAKVLTGEVPAYLPFMPRM